MSFHGPISLDFISFAANYIREMVDADQKLLKRIFKVFIELVQNVSYYSAEVRKNEKHPNTRRGVGWFRIDESEIDFVISTGNLINKEHGPILLNNCKEINQLDEVKLRDLKRKTRRQASIKDIGAHIGLIHTGIISGNPLEIEISDVNEQHSFFVIKVKINKN